MDDGDGEDEKLDGGHPKIENDDDVHDDLIEVLLGRSILDICK